MGAQDVHLDFHTTLELSLKVVEFVQSCFTFTETVCTGLLETVKGEPRASTSTFTDTAPELDSVADDDDGVERHVL